ncbi:hypothetical protein, partial [Actinobacillus pleuropneumoniae]|uniref:hypothetical protein n=1 Tax=Actinobacillus pleuropneumoniae TaxID=715 RepID=UPI00227C23E7
VEKYAHDADFQEVYLNLSQGHQFEELDYHVHDNLLCHLGKLCVPQGETVMPQGKHTLLLMLDISV